MPTLRYIQVFLFFLFGCVCLGYAQVNSEFTDILVHDKLGSVVGITFDNQGTMYAWTKGGKVSVVEDGEKLAEPLVDISEEVATYGDHGLLGFALHPNFTENGYFYLLYVVDRHHLLYYGTNTYSPGKTISNEATIGRVTRYTADKTQNFHTIIPDSRKVILGKTKKDGIPLLHTSHGVGSLTFGEDGTLLVSAGDGGTFAGTDVGGVSAESYNFQALADSIITPKEDIGAFRSQLLDCLNGKVLRIDPETGLGIPSNPFFTATAPESPRSKVWALGLRNPYRIRVKPGTGSHNPQDGDPGVIFIGDVGWAFWEELNIADGPGINFGWPFYEGVQSRWQYFYQEVYNQDALNPLYDPDLDCAKPFFQFKDLLLPATTESNPYFPNPCTNAIPIPVDIPTFTHRRPALSWSNISWNTEEQGTHIPGFDSLGNPIFYDINAVNSPVRSDTFTGFCSVAGDFYTGTKFPISYRNQFLGADMKGWVRKMRFDSDYQLETISELSDQTSKIIHMEMNPVDECMYYVRHHPYFEVRKICYGGNLPPVAKIEISEQYGTSPLTVDFDATHSFDPEGGELSFQWDFGDGNSSNLTTPSHVFSTSDTKPQPFTVTLTVTDSVGDSDREETIISLNNTPPVVEIISIEDGDRYPVSGSTILPLEALLSDQESDENELSIRWEIFTHHNTHVHPEPMDTNRISQVLIAPEGCNGETFWYEIQARVSDPHGLESQETVNLYPYCDSAYVKVEQLSGEATENSIFLNWNLDQYKAGLVLSVQHSEDLTSFSDIGEVEVKAGQRQFLFEDFSPTNGLNFYRIKLSGPDKWYDYSPYVLLEYPLRKSIELFPNPFDRQMTIYFEEVFEGANVEVFNSWGNVLFSFRFPENQSAMKHQINVGNWPSGIYFFKISNGEQETIKKMIKD